MRSVKVPVIVLLVLAIISVAHAGPYTPGNIVVSRVGDGTAALDTSAAPVFLDEYTPAGVLVQSVALPTAVSGSHRSLTLAGSNGNEGFLTRSTDGRYLLIGGYDAPAGTASVNGLPNTFVGGTVTADRVVGRVDFGGNVDTTTAFSGDNSFSTQQIRSIASTNGIDLWVAGGTNADRTGVRYTTFGSDTSLRVHSSTAFNFRYVNIFDDAGGNPQLYASRGSSNHVNTIGVGLPTTNSSANNPVGLFEVPGFSTYDFLFTDPNTLYTTNDDNSAGLGGIVKWTLDEGTWSLAYVLNVDLPSNPVRGLTGYTDASGNTVLYATTGNGRNLVAVTDLGELSPFTTIATAGDNMGFRGVELAPVPEPATLALVALGGAMFLRRRRI